MSLNISGLYSKVISAILTLSIKNERGVRATSDQKNYKCTLTRIISVIRDIRFNIQTIDKRFKQMKGEFALRAKPTDGQTEGRTRPITIYLIFFTKIGDITFLRDQSIMYGDASFVVHN